MQIWYIKISCTLYTIIFFFIEIFQTNKKIQIGNKNIWYKKKGWNIFHSRFQVIVLIHLSQVLYPI